MHSMPTISLHHNSNWLGTLWLGMLARLIYHLTDSMLCLYMVRASVGFGIGRLAKFHEF
ncbi:hypothetical protein MKW92_053824 [Papaver armeniacum]|nr:hypothetical protein MKW92_053824 [Papaver armeniacum]